MGVNYERVRQTLVCYSIPFDLIDPKRWQFEFNLGGKQSKHTDRRKEYAARKTAHHMKAKELFPQLKITKDVADAMLIAEYQWRHMFGRLTRGR